MSVVIRVENLSKYYRLGEIGGGTLREDLNRWWARVRGRPDPWLKIGETDHGNRQGDAIWALRDVSFEVQEGEILGVIGRNGAGKSTLLKILSRITAPTSGRALIKGRVGSLLEVGTGFHPELTGRENIYLNGTILGMTRAEVDRKLEEIVEFAEMAPFIDTPVKRYSSGMTVRLAFAVAAHLEPEILIIDEVLAVGDVAFQKKCLGKMDEVASTGRTILFVSHNLDSVRRLCSKGIVLLDGRIITAGTADDAVENYLVRDKGADTAGSSIVLEGAPCNGYDVLRIELIDLDGKPLDRLRTWDSVTFRIVFRSPASLSSGSVVLQIATLNGSVLHLCSTQPDRKYQMTFKEGINHIDCHFPRLLLAAGNYRIGAALALPNISWLVKKLDGGMFEVGKRDVYESGLAPSLSRYAIAGDYEWR